MKIITVSNQKGGTGKTALTFEIGTILSNGHRVLFIDLDGQRDLTKMLTNEHHEAGAMDMLTGTTEAQNVIVDISNYISLIPATDSLLNADTVLINKGGNISGQLRKALRPLKEYDYVVIDTPPKLGTLTVNALTAADVVIIPTLAESNSIDGVLNFLKTFTGINRARPEPATIGGIVVTRYNGRSLINRQMMESLEQIADRIHTDIYPVKETVKLREAHFFGRSITEYAPKTETAGQLITLVRGIK